MMSNTVTMKQPWLHSVLAARDYCLRISPSKVDLASFDRVTNERDVSHIQGYLLDTLTDLQNLCQTVGFIVALDEDGFIRAYLPGEWPRGPR